MAIFWEATELSTELWITGRKRPDLPSFAGETPLRHFPIAARRLDENAVPHALMMFAVFGLVTAIVNAPTPTIAANRLKIAPKLIYFTVLFPPDAALLRDDVKCSRIGAH